MVVDVLLAVAGAVAVMAVLPRGGVLGGGGGAGAAAGPVAVRPVLRTQPAAGEKEQRCCRHITCNTRQDLFSTANGTFQQMLKVWTKP